MLALGRRTTAKTKEYQWTRGPSGRSRGTNAGHSLPQTAHMPAYPCEAICGTRVRKLAPPLWPEGSGPVSGPCCHSTP
jgi:hypothetical protein